MQLARFVTLAIASLAAVALAHTASATSDASIRHEAAPDNIKEPVDIADNNARHILDQPAAPVMILSPQEALDAAKSITLPDGVTFTGVLEPLKQPLTDHETTQDDLAMNEGDLHDAEAHEQWWGGAWGATLGGWGTTTLGGWGSLGCCGPYRFAYSCGGINGWAYPLSYWNSFGPSIYGASCGLGYPFGGFFYC